VNAATAGDEIDGEREAGVLAPALVLMRMRKERRAVREPWSWPGGAWGWLAVMPGAVRRWLFTVAGHVATGMWRTGSRGMMMSLRASLLAGPVEPIDQATTAMQVRRAFAQLRSGHRQVIAEMFCLGRPVTEIARLLGIPEDTFASRACCGLRRLRQVLPAASGVHAAQAPGSFPRALTAETRSPAA
jgi:hypothetical protein